MRGACVTVQHSLLYASYELLLRNTQHQYATSMFVPAVNTAYVSSPRIPTQVYHALLNVPNLCNIRETVTLADPSLAGSHREPAIARARWLGVEAAQG